MKTKLLFLCILAVLIGCKSEEIELKESENNQAKFEETVSKDLPGVVKGAIRIKFKPEVGNNITISSTSGKLRSSAGNEMNNLLQELGATGMQRVFPHAGKYEERTRKEGLHLWYEITFDESKSFTRATRSAANIAGVDIVEEIFEPQLAPYSVQDVDLPTTRATTEYPFNDPGLYLQWHYNNDGTRQNLKKGADINLFAAWERATGTPNIIVSVVDGGIDVKHVDLKDNLYVNEAELNGRPGVDDDGNGYIDDIYGYNFVSGNGKVSADSHGTHVAGTVGARNNNGIGVCGVAGGNGRSQQRSKIDELPDICRQTKRKLGRSH